MSVATAGSPNFPPVMSPGSNTLRSPVFTPSFLPNADLANQDNIPHVPISGAPTSLFPSGVIAPGNNTNTITKDNKDTNNNNNTKDNIINDMNIKGEPVAEADAAPRDIVDVEVFAMFVHSARGGTVGVRVSVSRDEERACASGAECSLCLEWTSNPVSLCSLASANDSFVTNMCSSINNNSNNKNNNNNNNNKDIAGDGCGSVFCGGCVRSYVRREVVYPRFGVSPVRCPGMCRRRIPVGIAISVLHEEERRAAEKAIASRIGALCSVRCPYCDETQPCVPGIEHCSIEACTIPDYPFVRKEGDAHDADLADVARAKIACFIERKARLQDRVRDHVMRGVENRLKDTEGVTAASRRLVAKRYFRRMNDLTRRFVRYDCSAGELAEAIIDAIFLCNVHAVAAEVLAAKDTHNNDNKDNGKNNGENNGENKDENNGENKDGNKDTSWREDEQEIVWSHILPLCGDAERRFALALALLRARPSFSPLCECGARVCFHCQTEDHEGISCRENEEQIGMDYDVDVRHCHCGAPYMRGDGCDDILCVVCGESFNWEDAT